MRRWILLEEQLEREDVVEFNARNAADKAIRHALVLADVHVLHVVELCISRILDVKVILARLIIVDVKHNCRARVLARKAHIVELSEPKVDAREGDFLSLKAEIKDNFQGTGIGDENRQILAGNVGAKAEQEALLVGRREAHTNVLGNGGSPRAEEVVLDDGIGAKIDANFCAETKSLVVQSFLNKPTSKLTISTNWSLEGTPAAIARKSIVAFEASSVIQARIRLASPNAAS